MARSDMPEAGFPVDVEGRHATLRIDRDLDLSCIDQANAAVERILAGDVSHVLVDLSRAQFVDSTGVGVLLRLQRSTIQRGGRAVVVSDAPGVLRVLDVLGLAEQLPVAADEAAAHRLLGG